MPKARKVFASADDTEAAFYEALGRADIHAFMALWAEDEEAVCVHPGGPRLIGPAAIRASWEMILERGPVFIRPIQVHVTHNSMTSIHNLIEDIQRSVNAPADLYVIATNVYIKTPLGWRVIAHHASIASGQPPVELVRPSTLH